MTKLKDLFNPSNNNNTKTCPNLAALVESGSPPAPMS